MVLITSTFFLAYLLGSIPSAVWIGKAFYKTDVRLHGSKNAGATNTLRVLGKKAGFTVLFFDMFKGMLASALPYLSGIQNFSADDFTVYQLLVGVAAVLGHLFPVFAKFKGGKGVATLAGISFFVFPISASVGAVIFLLVFVITHYVSLGSILASISFSLVVIFYFNLRHPIILTIVLLIPILILFTHRKNIVRLLNGTENKIFLNKN